MKIASRATPEGLAGNGLSTIALWHQDAMEPARWDRSFTNWL